ncbi:hypothetical protein KBY88_08325 [Cyanobium sp. Morenito 9A2]|nr:hypothetical protein [Cyanobium sp. Morenito 9A2]
MPLGCAGSLVSVLGFVGLAVFGVFGLMKSSIPYKEALGRAQGDPVVRSRLGAPIQGGLFLSGQVNVSGTDGSANLAIPISGPKGSGTLVVQARKARGEWTYSTLEVQPDGPGTPIKLIGDAL